jgi:GNAT superfamily N-acetyltransferase
MDRREGTAPGYAIVNYDGGRDPEVAALILAIQRDDVGLFVPIEEQPELLDIGGAYRDGGFWVAVAGGQIVGTIGMMRYGASGVLKKLFVRQDYRGPDGAAHRLYDKAIAWAAARGLTAIFLDTPSVATRSHAFYQRRGFHVVDRAELPTGYDFPDRDSLIFKLDMLARDRD